MFHYDIINVENQGGCFMIYYEDIYGVNQKGYSSSAIADDLERLFDDEDYDGYEDYDEDIFIINECFDWE